MSGKQSKRLRAAAKGLAVMFDQQGKTIADRGFTVQEHKRVEMPTAMYEGGERLLNKELTATERVFAVTVTNKKDSLRGIVRYLKKGLKA